MRNFGRGPLLTVRPKRKKKKKNRRPLSKNARNSEMAKLAIWFVAFCLVSGELPAEEKIRRRRYLVYPKPESKVQLIIGTGVPIASENHAVTMGWVLKAKYLLPMNASDYTDSYVTFQKRSAEPKPTRYDFYRILENAAESFGGGGKECMLRTICEASRVPLRASGLAGQILRVLLLPSSTDETPLIRSDLDYHNAEILGKEEGVSCKSLYPSCSLPLIDLLTVIT